MMLYSTSEPIYIQFLNRYSRAKYAFGLLCQWVGQRREGLNRLKTTDTGKKLATDIEMEEVNRACRLAKKYRVVYYEGDSRYAIGKFR